MQLLKKAAENDLRKPCLQSGARHPGWTV